MSKSADDYEVEKFLRLESNAFNQDKECERVLAMQYSPDPLVILDMPVEVYIKCAVEDREIKMQYRKRSLLVHPDKCKHPKAQEAFDILKKTEQLCTNPQKKRLIFEYINEARRQVFHERKIKIPVEDDVVNLYSDAPTQKFDPESLQKQYPNIGREIQMQFYKNMVDQSRRDEIRLKNMQEREIQVSEREVKVEKKTRDFEKELDQVKLSN